MATKKIVPQADKRPPKPMSDAEKLAFVMGIANEQKAAAAEKDKEEDTFAASLKKRPESRSKDKKTVKFPAADLREFKKMLIAARDEAMQGVETMKRSGFTTQDDVETDGGDGTAQTIKLQALGQVGNIKATLQKIEEAMHRIEDGTYGICTVCGQLIRKPRLMNQPFATTCMECQHEMEKGVR